MNDHGFTLIELIIVVAIIGILAAIAIPQFSLYRVRTNDTIALTDLRNVTGVMELYYGNNTRYPLTAIAGVDTISGSIIDGMVISLSPRVTLWFESNQADYIIMTFHAGGSRDFVRDSDSLKIYYRDFLNGPRVTLQGHVDAGFVYPAPWKPY